MKTDNLFEDESDALLYQIAKANANGEIEYQNLDEPKQGSKEWFAKRIGKFTGSRFPDLLTKGRGQEQWGETAIKVINRVFIERDLTDIGTELYIDELFKTEYRQTMWGNKYESYAVEAYSKKLDVIVEPTYFKVHGSYEFIGGSADGKVVGQNKIIEVKCPADILVHAANVELVGDGIDESHKYYAQIQGNIEIYGADSCDFISFDPRRKADQLVVITVNRDQVFIERLLTRILIAERSLMYKSAGLSTKDALLLAERDAKC